MATLSVLSPWPLSPFSPQVSVALSSPPFVRDLLLWLSPFVINLITLHSAVRLKHHRARAETLLGSGAIVFAQAAAVWRAVVP